jgi:hypothetical protein
VASTAARVDRAGRQRLPIETRVNGGNMIVEAALASRSESRRPCDVASSGGSSSPRCSPNCSSSAASISAASGRIFLAICS